VDPTVGSVEGQDRFGVYADGMQELDWVVGELLGKLDELGIADDTTVIFATDNGAEKFTWPDGGTTPFREKGLGWEGGSGPRSRSGGLATSPPGRS
jgi:arylsulfatase